MTACGRYRTLVVLALSVGWGACVWAQTAGPATAVPQAKVHADGDKGLTGEIPLDTPGVADPKDVSAMASPVAASRGGGLWIKPGTVLNVRVEHALSSGKQGNGAMVHGVLLHSVRMGNGTALPQGTPVKATVLAAAPAGKIQSAGVLSLEVMRVGNVDVATNVLEFSGQRGKADVADATPAQGTEAMVPAGSVLHFKVLGAGDTLDKLPKAGSASGMTPKQ